MKRFCLLPLLFLPCLSLASDLGITGLIDTPTARMRVDGEFAAAISKQSLVDIYSLNYQATPWLETTFRYSAFGFGLYDRSYEAKFRVNREGDILPEVAIGIRDLLGTGVFSSEYVVANKQFGNFDVSLGLGWGRFAGEGGTLRNPLISLSEQFRERESETAVGDTGQIRFGSIFSGPNIGVFGGVSYSIPEARVRLLAEYNSDRYEYERSNTQVEADSRLSFGVEWEALPGITLSGSRQFGDQWGFSISSALNSQRNTEVFPIVPFVSSLELAGSELNGTGRSFNTWYERLLYDTERSGLRLYEAKSSVDRTEVTLVIANTDFALNADAVNRFLTLAELHLPNSYRVMNIVLNEGGIQPLTLSYLRSGFAGQEWLPRSHNQIEILAGRELADPDNRTTFSLGRLSINANLGTKFQVFDPDNPLRHQLNVKLTASSRLGLGWFLRSSYIIDIDNNFGEITRESNSVLPRVRSDVARYLKEGPSGMESLYLSRRNNLSRDIFYRLYGGVLEEMYSGFGGEVLYQPFRSRIAYGASANWVRQRDYDKSFRHLDYSTVTAFVSLYWATPFYGYDVAVHAGQFLAKDLGAKFEVRRTMDNGWMIGAWATLTDVPFDEFGEGSFDKGIFLRIPLNGVMGSNSRSRYSTSIRSIQRDGGQMLENFSGVLWHDLRSARYDALDRNRHRIVAGDQ